MYLNLHKFLLKFAKEDALGIPSRSVQHELPTVNKPTTWEFVIHDHDAERRGKHYDLRLGDPSTSHAHSWALQTVWPKPGESVWAISQPTHTLTYMDWEGTIPSGTYGGGTVKKKERSKTEIINSSPGHISFNLYKGSGPEEYTLHRIADNKWKLYNRTFNKKDNPQIPDYKPKYRSTTIAKIDPKDSQSVLSAKIDDAHNLFILGKKDEPIRVVSYRPSERNKGFIEHTHKIKALNQMVTPANLAGTIIRGGIYAMTPENDKPVPSHILAGLLNSNVWKSREQQKQYGNLVPVVYDIVKYKNKNVENAPYKKKLELLKTIKKELPILSLPRMAITKDQKEKLISDITGGKIKETKEGLVVWPLTGNKPPQKAKLTNEHDVYLREFYGGTGKYKDLGVGGFRYSHTEKGPIVGNVGTGLSDKQRKDMHENPDKYLGLVAKITAFDKFKSEALRAPAFKGFHLDKNPQTRLDQVKK